MSTSFAADDFDGLTGLHNAWYFQRALGEEVARAQHDRRPLALILFDIDDFESVNDRFGHAMGDMLLRRMAERVREVLGSAGIAARYGGDEFVILLPCSTRVDAERVQQRLDAVVGADPMELDTRVRFSASIAQLEVGESAESFFRRADDALYQTKRRRA